MLSKIFVIMLLSAVSCCEGYIYSSFWAPLFHRAILHYRVDVPFDPRVGQMVRAHYTNTYGYRGENLIADLGKGGRPGYDKPEQIYGDIKVVDT